MRKYRKISFVSEREMMDMVPWRNTALISIAEPGRSADVKGWKHVLRLWFHDISKSQDGMAVCILPVTGGHGGVEEMKAFDAKQAREVISFLDGPPIDVDSIVVHCHAGISRSAAVAEFIRNVKRENPGFQSGDESALC
jgi:predicted protein tyrosine phosphatase